MNDLNTLIFDFLKASLALGTLALTGYGIPWLRAHVSEKRLHNARTIAGAAVNAVEQVYPDLDPKVKLAQAIRRAEDLAASHGVVLTDDQWQTLIEQEVKWMKPDVVPVPAVTPVS